MVVYDIFYKVLKILENNNIILLYDNIFPINENGKFVRVNGIKFIILKEALNDQVDVILTLLHECSHALNNDDIYAITLLQKQHAEYVANCYKISNYIRICAHEYGVPTPNIPALMKYLHIYESCYYDIISQEVLKYYNSDGTPKPEFE